MEKTRILVVDDSALVRKLVTMALEREPDIEAVVAPSGSIALSKIERFKPHLVVLDVEMPDMDGLETLAKIRAINPKLPVIMFSALTESGSKIAMEAIARGAADCVLKPSQTGSMDVSMEYVRENLMTRIRGICRLPKPGAPGAPAKPAITAATAYKPAVPPSAAPAVKVGAGSGVSKPLNMRLPGLTELLVIGVSTGGPNALAALVPAFTQDFPVPVLIVQHMPPMFTRLLAERLGTLCGLSCKEAVDGEIVTAGQLRVAPGNFHMTVTRDEAGFLIGLNQDAPENSCRPAVDVLFRTAAACSRNRLVSVILTGMGQDGLLGAERIKAEGGTLLAQDEATSVVWGMPGAVVHAGLADGVFAIGELGQEVARRVRGLKV
jgi:two-component system, chemotaxis family, protein-glutamate methylesterase/glutaminase